MAALNWDDVAGGVVTGFNAGQRALYLGEETAKLNADRKQKEKERRAGDTQDALTTTFLTGSGVRRNEQGNYVSDVIDNWERQFNETVGQGGAALPTSAGQDAQVDPQRLAAARKVLMPDPNSMSGPQATAMINAANGMPPDTPISQEAFNNYARMMHAVPGADPVRTNNILTNIYKTFTQEVAMGAVGLQHALETGQANVVAEQLPKLYSRILDGYRAETRLVPGGVEMRQINEKTGSASDWKPVTSEQLGQIAGNVYDFQKHREFVLAQAKNKADVAHAGAQTDLAKEQAAVVGPNSRAQNAAHYATAEAQREHARLLRAQADQAEEEAALGLRKTTPPQDAAFGKGTTEWLMQDPALANHVKDKKLNPQQAAGLQSNVAEFAQGIWKGNKGMSDAKARELGREAILGGGKIGFDDKGVNIEIKGNTYRLPNAFARYYKPPDQATAAPGAGGNGGPGAQQGALPAGPQPAFGQGSQPPPTSRERANAMIDKAVGAVSAATTRAQSRNDIEAMLRKQLMDGIKSGTVKVPDQYRRTPQRWIQMEIDREMKQRAGGGALPIGER